MSTASLVPAVALMALAAAALTVFFHFGWSLGTTYAPPAGMIALTSWSYATAAALLVGAALAAQLEAVRVGSGAPRRDPKTRMASRIGTSDGGRPAEVRAG